MSSLTRFRFRATRPHWPQAWVIIGLIAGIACFVAIADGIRSWSVLVVYGIAALSLFLSVQPWRSFLELNHHGFRMVWGAHSTFIRWRDVTGLRPVLQHSGRYGGVAFTAAAQRQSLLGVSHTQRATVTGRIDGRLYGISDGQLYQLMTHLRSGVVPDSRMRGAKADIPKRPSDPMEVSEG